MLFGGNRRGIQFVCLYLLTNQSLFYTTFERFIIILKIISYFSTGYVAYRSYGSRVIVVPNNFSMLKLMQVVTTCKKYTYGERNRVFSINSLPSVCLSVGVIIIIYYTIRSLRQSLSLYCNKNVSKR